MGFGQEPVSKASDPGMGGRYPMASWQGAEDQPSLG